MKVTRFPVRSKCPRCKHLSSRFYDLRRHALGVHGIGREQLGAFLKEAKDLNARRRSRIAQRRKIKAARKQEGGFQTTDLAGAKRACAMREQLEKDDVKTNSGFVVKPMGRAPQTKRLHKADIARCGFISHFKELCPTAKCFQLLNERAGDTSPATAKQWAGLVNRFLSFAKDEYPEFSELDAFLSTEVANSFVEKYAKFFANQSTINAIVSVSKALHYLRYNETFKKAVCLRPGMEPKVNRLIEHWNCMKRTFHRKARNAQRVKLANTPVEDWQVMFPVSLTLDYLAKARKTFLTEDDRSENRFGDLNKQDTIRALRSACALIIVLNGCRQVVALRLAPANLKEATTWDGCYIVRVNSHKTKNFYGPARLVLRPHQYKLLTLLAELVNDRNTVFGVPDVHGSAAEVLFQDFNDYVAETTGRAFFMRFNNGRKVAESYCHLVEGLPKNSQGLAPSDVVAKFLMHSRGTRDLFYKTLTESEMVNLCRTYQSLLAVLAALELLRDGKVYVPEAKHGKPAHFPFYLILRKMHLGLRLPT